MGRDIAARLPRLEAYVSRHAPVPLSRHPAWLDTWQYHLRAGSVGDVRPDNPKYHRAIRIWQRLPLVVTQRSGPMIVRGIP